jgi:hypothetical protein
MLRILEHPTRIPRPVSMILAYPALDFNFTSWMSPANLRVLRTEQSETHIPGLVQGKDHMRHKSPLSVVEDVKRRPKGRQRQKSWGEALSSKLPGLALTPTEEKSGIGPLQSPTATGWTKSLPRTMSTKIAGWLAPAESDDKGDSSTGEDPVSEVSDSEDEHATMIQRAPDRRKDADKSLRDRVKTPREEQKFDLKAITIEKTTRADAPDGAGEMPKKRKKAPIGTRLTMTSRVGYFQDRVISPSMVS